MYIWIGVLLPDDFSQSLKEELKVINKNIGLNEDAINFPQHISLKIVFETQQFSLVLKRINDIFATYHPFIVSTKRVEMNGPIIWIRMKDNSILEEIHKKLDFILKYEFNIFPQEYDTRFIFHSTLFIDQKEEERKKMMDVIKDKYQSVPLYLYRIAIGIAEGNNPIDIKIVKIINLE